MARPWPRSVTGVVLIAGAYSLMELLPIGAQRPEVALTVASGVALALAIVWVAGRMPAERRTQIVVWFSLVFLNLSAVAVEGTLFAPELAPPASLAANLTRLLVASAAIGAIAARLCGVAGGVPIRAPSRPLYDWAWRLSVVAAVYVALYLVIGGINYSLVTRPYYESHVAGLTVPPAQTVLLYEPIRGLLIALSVLPLTRALRLRTRTVAVTAGSMLFIVGGLVPLLPQTTLPLYLRLASLWEIFGQNFSTGLLCVLVLDRGVNRVGVVPGPGGLRRA